MEILLTGIISLGFGWINWTVRAPIAVSVIGSFAAYYNAIPTWRNELPIAGFVGYGLAILAIHLFMYAIGWISRAILDEGKSRRR